MRYVKHNALAGRAERTAALRGLPGPGALLARSSGQRAACTRAPTNGRSSAWSRSVRCCGRCRPSPSTPTRWCRPSSVRMPASPSTAIAIPRRRSSCANRSPFAPTAMKCVLLHEGQVVAQHVRSYERGQLLVLPEHRLAALSLRQRPRQQALEQEFDAWGPEAREFHLGLNSRPVKTGVHLRRLLELAQVYGRTEVLAAITRALELATYDAAYVENLLLAERRRRQLPTPTLPTPKRRELIDDIELEPADPGLYDRFCHDTTRRIPMARPDAHRPRQLDRDLADLKLLEIAKHYREVLDEAARKGSSMLEVLATLIGMEQTAPPAARPGAAPAASHGSPNRKPWPSTTSTSPNDSQGGHRAVCSTATSSHGMAAPF